MDREQIIDRLSDVKDARKEWREAKRKFDQDSRKAMTRLVLEAARNRMSVEQIGKASGMTRREVRQYLRGWGVEPNEGINAASDAAADVLTLNAERLGVDPGQIDLMSPLVYLPLGNDVTRVIESGAVRQGVTELPLSEGWWCRSCEEFETGDDVFDNGRFEFCVWCGCPDGDHVSVEIKARG